MAAIRINELGFEADGTFMDLSGSDVKTTEHRYLFELENVIG